MVSERARAKMERIAARKTRPPKKKTLPLAELRVWWKVSAILTSKVAADVITSLLEYARAAAAAIRARVAAVVDVALAAVDVAVTVFVMNDGGRFTVGTCSPKPAATSLWPCAAAAATLAWRTRSWLLPSPPIAWTSASRPLCAAWRPATASAPPGGPCPTCLPRPAPPTLTPDPDPDRQPPADPGEPAAYRPPGQDTGEWEIPRIPPQYERAVLAGAVVREKLRTTTTATATATAVLGGAYDVARHQQAAMPEQLFAPEPADPEHDDQEPESKPREAIEMKALRALRESRTDVEALDLTAERLRRLGEAFTAAADRARTTMDRYAHRDGAEKPHPARRDGQQPHRPQEPGPQPGPHRSREAGH
ncbi:hypothetical protein [Streptomyces lushanensis]|uniref:hypothetical protein n=1 Tax=Streptomyces lushanensis TaxID=1434255 RepID=UPI000A430FFE|nr:hypothetical protein [Streptomyces lushanensis]